jgi:hypothetical protein
MFDPLYYYLDDNNVAIPTDDVHVASPFVGRRVAYTEVGPYRISTVFLSINHQYVEGSPPILWETMVFEGPDSFEDKLCRRYSSHQSALEGHNKVVKQLEACPVIY